VVKQFGQVSFDHNELGMIGLHFFLLFSNKFLYYKCLL
jgi:hypothetical protein